MDWEQHYRQLNRTYSAEYGQGPKFGGLWDVLTTPIEEQVAKFTMTRDNLNTVNGYIHAQAIKTPEAGRIASDWSHWWDTTGNPTNYTLEIPPVVWDEARNRKLQFDLANAVTSHERDTVVHVATTGMSSEQMQGQPDRRDPVTGTYFVPPAPILPPWAKPVLIGAAALGLGLSVIPILRKVILHV
jgi:hypothetical protein